MARFVNEIASIPAGQSLSNVVACSTGSAAFLHMPQEWTSSAMLSFQVSPDGTVFNDLFDSEGRELAFRVPVGASIRIPPMWDAVLYLRVRSGSRDAPVPQEADRAIVVTIDTSSPR